MLMLALGFAYVAALIQGLQSTMMDRLEQGQVACPPNDAADEDLVKSRTKACDVCVACKPCPAVPDAAAAKAKALLELERAHKLKAEVRRGLYETELRYVQFSTWLYRPTWYVVPEQAVLMIISVCLQ
jgi:hypothetical protein